MSTNLIDDIRQQLPGYPEKAAHLAAIDADLAQREKGRRSVALGVNYENPAREVLRGMLAAGESLDDLDRQVALRLMAEQAGVAASEALNDWRDVLQAELRAQANDPQVLPLLGEALSRVLEEIQGLGPLEEIDTQEAADKSKRYNDAGRLRELLRDIGQLRNEQRLILEKALYQWSKYSVLLVIENPVEVFRHTVIWLRPGYLEHTTDRGRQQEITVPWVWPLHNNLNSEDLTLWALRNGGRLWIPSLQQYEAAAKRLRAAAEAPRQDDGSHGEWFDPGPQRATTQSRTTGNLSRAANSLDAINA